MKSVSPPVTLCLEGTRKELNHDAKRFHSIASVAIQDLPLLAEELRTAVEQKDTKLVKHMSHSIHGVASNFRAEPLMRLAEKLKREYESLTESETSVLLSEISEASDGTITALLKAIECESVK